MTPPATQAPRVVKTRRIRFDYSPARVRRHFAGGDLLMSHVVAMLSAQFPDGEDFFVLSVRHYADRITDPVLKQQVAGFTGQETMHGREHRALNDRLQELGYPTKRVERITKRDLTRAHKKMPPMVQLAVTAALEHYTATLAEVLMSSEQARELLGEGEVRDVLLWHALEESEHKAVAFDVYRAMGGSEKMRIRTMRMITFGFLLGTIFQTVLSLLADRAFYNPVTLVRSARKMPQSPWLSKDVRKRIADYNRVGFHPDDNDNSELLEFWTNELFGPGGRLEEKLKSKAA